MHFHNFYSVPASFACFDRKTIYNRSPWKNKLQKKQALEDAISAAGGITQLARPNFGSHNVVGQWRINGVPAKHAPDIEALTGVMCERLCPEVNWKVLRANPMAEQEV